MIIEGGLVFEEDGIFRKKTLYIENHRFVESEEKVTDRTVIHAEGKKILPGLVDVHSHGAFGRDFSDGDMEGLKEILRYEKRSGITSYCPTSMTLPKDRLKRIFQSAEAIVPAEDMAVIRGINMEGPFLDPAKKGAHVEEWITPADASMVRELNKVCGGKIKLVTLAPNTEGAFEFIREMQGEVNISLGHTSADYDCAAKAFALGANHVTHLYNAMQPLGHRSPGLIGAAADAPHCMAELICDGYHVHPSAVRAAFSLFGPKRMVLISDSMRAAGMENGIYELGGQEVRMQDGKATLKDGTIAGSATNLFDCMRKAIEFGIPENQAIWAASRNPAKSIGVYDEVGSIEPGKAADLLIVTENYELEQVF